MQHKDNEIIQLNKTPNITYSCTSKCLSQNIHRGVLVAQASNGDLFYDKVNFTESLWSPVLYRKFLVSCPGETLTDVLLRQHICLKVQDQMV